MATQHHVCYSCQDKTKQRINNHNHHVDNLETHKIYDNITMQQILTILQSYTLKELAKQIVNYLTILQKNQMFNSNCWEYTFSLKNIEPIMEHFEPINGNVCGCYWIKLDPTNEIYICFQPEYFMIDSNKDFTDDMNWAVSVNLRIIGQAVMEQHKINQYYMNNIPNWRHNYIHCDCTAQIYSINENISEVKQFKKLKKIDMTCIFYFRTETEPDLKSSQVRMLAFYNNYTTRKKKRKLSSIDTVCHHSFNSHLFIYYFMYLLYLGTSYQKAKKQ